MSDRLKELAMRRRALLLRSDRLRAELAADQQVLLDALSGIDRAYTRAKKIAAPLLIVGAGALLLRRLFRRPRRAVARVAEASAAGGRGLLMRALFWVGMAQRALPYVSLVRSMWRSRSSQRMGKYSEPEQAG